MAFKIENGIRRLIESLQQKQLDGTWQDSFVVRESNAVYGAVTDAKPKFFNIPLFQQETKKENLMKLIQILGVGCPKCKALAANAEEAIRSLGVEARVEKVEKIAEILKFGVMITPALVVDGVVKSAGKVLSPNEIRKHAS